MKYKIIFFAFFVIFFNAISTVYSSEAKLPKEVYTDRAVIDLDTTLNKYYNLLFKVLKPQDFTELKYDQRKWLKIRNEIGLKQNYLPLLKECYTKRIDYLKSKFKAVAKPIIDGLITDQENIVKEEKLEVIENCNLNICKAYRLYLKQDDQKTASSELYNSDREILLKLAADVFSGKYNYNFDREDFDSCLKEGTSNIDLLLTLLSSPKLYEGIEDLLENSVGQIPLWLVIKHPDIMKKLSERFAPNIKAKTSLHQLPKFRKLDDLIDNMAYGRWVTTSYRTWRGSIYLDILARRCNNLNFMSFNPIGFASWPDDSKLSIKQKLQPLYDWSFEGIWNRKKYDEFKEAYDEAIIELKEYYRTNYNLSAYASKAEDLIASYVYDCIHRDAEYSHNSAYKLFSQPNISQDELKTKSMEFVQEDWNIALSIAILNNYAPEVISWLIKSGADVNSIFVYETPLMKAVERPDILKILLEAKADPNIATPYGKTPLFYAIGYDNLESVKLLLEYKANINASIKNKKALEELYDDIDMGNYFLLEEVAEFTPLIYSFAYSSEEIIDLLIKEGANTGGLKVDDFKAWVQGNKKINKNKLDNILKSLK